MNNFNFKPYPSGMRIYEVQPGDTYEKIAQQFGITPEELTLANPDVNPNCLFPGKQLYIPQQQIHSCTNNILHQVAPGDTIFTIVKQYNVTCADILAANTGIDVWQLKPGHVVCIPAAKPVFQQPCNTRPYIVQPGDTVRTIVSKFNLTPNALYALNPCTNFNSLQPGQTISVSTQWSEFTHAAHAICFKYPAYWQPVSEDRYEGPDGFFQLTALANGLLDLEKFHHHDCGSAVVNAIPPQVYHGNMLSPDCQPKKMHDSAILIFPYPIPSRPGCPSYKYLVILIEKSFLHDIASTIKFLI